LSRALILLNMGGMGSEDEVEIFLKNMFLDRTYPTHKSNIEKIYSQ